MRPFSEAAAAADNADDGKDHGGDDGDTSDSEDFEFDFKDPLLAEEPDVDMKFEIRAVRPGGFASLATP